MGGKSGGTPKQKVVEYSISIHVGVCAVADEVKRVWYGERSIWRGRNDRNKTIGVAKPGLFGGVKKEGGVRGFIEFYMGGADQKVTESLAYRMNDVEGGPMPAEADNFPGYRGITSLFFKGTDFGLNTQTFEEVFLTALKAHKGGKRIQTGFYFTANTPQIKPIWVTAYRAPKAPVRRGDLVLALEDTLPPRGSFEQISMYLTLDDSGSMDGFRLRALRLSVIAIIDDLIERQALGARVDLGIAGMNRDRLEIRECDASGFQAFKDQVSQMYASGNTPFDRSAEWIKTWFEETPESINNNINITVSDGAATGGSAITARNTLSTLMDRTVDVDMWGVCMDNPAGLPDLRLLHNMPTPVPLVDTGNLPENYLSNIIPRLGGDEPISVYFTLDDSGSMTSSRMSAMKTAVNSVIDELITRVQRGARVDLGWAGINRGRREIKYCSVSDLEGFKTLTNSVYANGGTNFASSAQWVRSWFTDASGEDELAGMAHIMLSDGEATGNSDDVAADILAPLINRTLNVDMWGVCMDNPSAVASLDKIQNMEPVVSVVNTNNVENFVNALIRTLPVARDANPVAVIAECYVNTSWGMGTSVDNIDWESFWAARDTIRDEELGVFYQWHSSTTIEAFIDDALETIKGAVFTHPRTGLLTIRLLRDDGDTENLREINPDNSDLDSFARKGWGEITTEVVTTWTNPDSEKEETVTVQNLASAARQGATISSSFNAHGLRTRESAALVGTRELAQDSMPVVSCEARTDNRFWDIVPYDRVLLNWPENGVGGVVMRVMKVGYGDSNSSSITLSLIEDVFSRSMAVYVEPSESLSPPPNREPVPIPDPRIIALPAFVAAKNDVDVRSATYPETAMTVLAAAPNSASNSFDLAAQVVEANGDVEWEDAGTNTYVGAGTLTEPLVREVMTSSFALTGASTMTAPNNLLLIGGVDLPDDALELALVKSVNEDGTVELMRGVLDTVPQAWEAGTLVWITTNTDWKPLPAVLSEGQSIALKLLSLSTGGLLDFDVAPQEDGIAESRLTLPTRPAGLTANGMMWTSPDATIQWPVELSWVSRNRLLEDSVMLAWDEAGMPPEEGTEYRVVVEGVDEVGEVTGEISTIDTIETTLLLDETVMVGEHSGAPYIRATVYALRDELLSWQGATLTFKGSLSPPINVAAEYRPPVAPSNPTIEQIIE